MPPIEKDEPLYMIGVAASLCEMHPQTLRLYERLGLVQPKRLRGKARLYSQADIERLQKIRRLTKEMGVNLAGVEIILNLLDKIEQMQEKIDNETEKIRQEIETEIRRRFGELEDNS